MKIGTAMKKYLAIALAVVLVLSLAACSSSKTTTSASTSAAASSTASSATSASTASSTSAASSSAASSSSSEPVTLKFQQWWGVELPEGYLDNVVKTYEDKTGVKIELISAPWADTKTAITAGAANNTMADIVSVDGAWLAEFVKMGILTDVEAAGVDTSLAGDTWKVDGTTYVVPINNFTYPMYVNMSAGGVKG